MRYLYTLTVLLYGLGIRLASLFSTKARLWVGGRKQLFSRLEDQLGKPDKTAWFHCASLGEFEQGRPVIEAFREKHPEFKILLTFFSPSGYEIRKDYPLADIITYLPLDTPSHVKRFLDITRPEMVFFIKYEYWYNFIRQLKQRGIPIYIISGIFRSHQHFFRWYGGWFRKQLQNITCFFLQNKESVELLHSIGIDKALLSGDTRFDRVFAIAARPKAFPLVESFSKEIPVILFGSTWPEDEAVFLPLIRKNNDRAKFIIAPHEVYEERISEIIQKSGITAVRFSDLKEIPDPSVRLIVVDSIGQLSSLYQYADIAYIGGGFGKGIHNILEAATFGLPVIFGSNYQKFLEAKELIDLQGAWSIASSGELEFLVTGLLADESKRKATGAVCMDYIQSHTGATQIILKTLSSILSDDHA
jgi:3-deoxy-D-manno-octulosonic-acid transferase